MAWYSAAGRMLLLLLFALKVNFDLMISYEIKRTHFFFKDFSMQQNIICYSCPTYVHKRGTIKTHIVDKHTTKVNHWQNRTQLKSWLGSTVWSDLIQELVKTICYQTIALPFIIFIVIAIWD